MQNCESVQDVRVSRYKSRVNNYNKNLNFGFIKRTGKTLVEEFGMNKNIVFTKKSDIKLVKDFGDIKPKPIYRNF